MGNSESTTAPSPMTAKIAELDKMEQRWITSVASATAVVPSKGRQRRLILVMNQLPVRVTPTPRIPWRWNIKVDENCQIVRLTESPPAGADLVFVGTLPGAAELPQTVRDELATRGYRLHRFIFFPVFLRPPYDSSFPRLCKDYLNRALHSVLPFTLDDTFYGSSFAAAWDHATALFADAVSRALRSAEDLVWVHDYHLFLLPSNFRCRHPTVRLGFSLHAPFPSPDIFLALPPALRILHSLLCCDLLGFYALDQARHFLACCNRALGLRHCLRRSPSPHGFLGIDHLGRTIGIHVLFPGVARFQMARYTSSVLSPSLKRNLSGLRRQFSSKIVLLGIDELDIFKSINLRLLAFERLLQKHDRYQGRIILFQVISGVKPDDERSTLLLQDIRNICERINGVFGSDNYRPILLFAEKVISLKDKATCYMLADCLVITAMRDGVNLFPYEYVVTRQADLSNPSEPKKSRLVLSEFIGCSQALCRATTINPLDIDNTAEALVKAIDMSEEEQQEQHEKHYTFIKTHDVAFWSRSFIEDLMNCSVGHSNNRVSVHGLTMTVSQDSFTELQEQMVTSVYATAASRVILLDYDRTLESESSDVKAPKEWVIEVLTALCADHKNAVFIVSGRTKNELEVWFENCRGLGIAAEHGYYLRWPGQNEWITTAETIDLDWIHVARPVMEWYAQATEHSKMEIKDSAIVWQYEHADSNYASAPAKEMVDHLKDLLKTEPVVVKTGHCIVEVHPKGVNKGSAAKKILSAMADNRKPAHFVLCMGDDSSDEDMFEYFATHKHEDVVPPRATVITCKVAKKPSKAKYYVENMDKVKSLLLALTKCSSRLSVAS